MFRTIRIRNVPEDLYRTLKARAAMAGMSLSEYLLAEIRRSAEQPTLEELRRRLATRWPVRVRPSPAQTVRTERGRG